MSDKTLEGKSRSRIASIDIYRGMVMFLMLAEVLHLDQLQERSAGLPSWLQTIFEWISFHTSHVEWRGASLHDMIQPSFSFLVGTAMAFSIASRQSKGQSYRRMLGHAVFRSLLLIFLGIFLRSLAYPKTNFTFDDTLTQIGLGYWILFLCSSLPMRWLIGVIAVVLVGYWGAFALFQPPDGFQYAAVGLPENWPHHFSGFQSHWNKNSNLAWYVDGWWMNLFPRESPFIKSDGGYCTLSFIPTLGTMLLGLVAGRVLRDVSTESSRVLALLVAAVVCLMLAWLVDFLGLCPIVKRIWTPSWVLWSGGICFLWLLVLHILCDICGWQRWSLPLQVIGANSIVAYVMSWTMEGWTVAAIERHFGWLLDLATLGEFRSFVLGALTLVFFWLILWWLYRHRVFIRI